jgi:Flp pilus assembly protein TadB
MRLAVILLVLFVLAFPVAALAQDQAAQSADQQGAAQAQNQAQGTAQAQTQGTVQAQGQQNQTTYGTVNPVSPREFTDKVNRFVGEVNGMVAGIIVPLAMFAMLVSAAALALGSIIGFKAVSRFGWGGLTLSALGLLVFWGIPVILGLIKSLAGYFAQ